MKYMDEIRELFKLALEKSELKCSHKNRTLDETYYFDAYLDFINNSVNYSRYKTTIKGHEIKGKYLNEKVNKWNNYGIFDIMYQIMLTKYTDVNKSKLYHIDGKIIVNKFCNEKDNLGRNIKYKSKNSINLQAVVDNSGIPIGIDVLKGSDSEVSNMVEVLKRIELQDFTHLQNSNKHKKYLSCDAGYDSEINRSFLLSKGYTPLIWFNKRNTKNKKKIKKKKIVGHKKEKYKKRHIVENYFSWIDNKIPRLVRIYDKKITNYLNMVKIAAIDLIMGRMCV